MYVRLWRDAPIVLFAAVMMAVSPAHSAELLNEIAPTGKLRVAIAISTAGGACAVRERI